MLFSLFKTNKTSDEYALEAKNAFVNMDYKNALKLYDKAIVNSSSDDKDNLALYFFYQALINKSINNIKTALNLINKAIELKDDNYNFYLERGEIKKIINDETAKLDLEKAYYLLKGFLSDEDYVEVLKVFSYDIQLRKHLNDYAYMYIQINNPFKAIELINKYIEKNPNDEMLYDLKTDILSKIKDYENALKTINNAIKIAPSTGHYYLMRGGIYIQSNNYKCAKQDIEKALSLNVNEDDKNACMIYKKTVENALS